WQHDEPTAEHHCETAGGIEPPCAVLQTATSATRSCGPQRSQQGSNLRSPVPETGVLSTGPWKLGAPGWIRTTRARGTWFTARRNRPLCHRRSGCPTGFEPVKAWLTTKSLSHLGQGTSRPGRFRTCDLRRVKAALHQTELQAVRAPRRTRTSNNEFVIRHDLRFTMRAWYPHQEPNLGIRLVEPALFH